MWSNVFERTEARYKNALNHVEAILTGEIPFDIPTFKVNLREDTIRGKFLRDRFTPMLENILKAGVWLKYDLLD